MVLETKGVYIPCLRRIPGCFTLVLNIDSLKFKYRNDIIIDGLSLNVTQGTILGVVGASGAGKTTLIRLIAGIIRPFSGVISLFGEAPSAKLWDRIGYMPQLQALYTDLSVQQNIDFFARLFGLARRSLRREIVESTIRRVSLWEKRNRPITNLSGGERQRVSLSIALVHKPDLLLLDEPTVGLDPQLRSDLWKHFHDLADNGTTVIISSHAMEDARRCDQVGFLQFGRFIALGAPSDLVAATGNQDATLEDAFLFFMGSNPR